VSNSRRNVGNYQPTLTIIAEERRSHLRSGGNLKSQSYCRHLYNLYNYPN